MKIRERMREILAAVFPRRCPFCGRIVPAGQIVCGTCAAALPWAADAARPSCGDSRNRRAYERCIAPFYYEGPARDGILRMKYANHPAAAGSFAALARPVVEREYAGIGFDCVTAVPMTAAEQRTRGFNQAALFGRGLARELSLPYREMLRKPRPVRPQHLCSAKERQQNVRGAYTALRSRKAAAVLLVDDVVTTGATLGECAEVLRRHGAERVFCVTVACVRRRENPSASSACEKTGKSR